MNKKCPLSSEYSACVQNIQYFIEEQELRSGDVFLKKTGLPMAWSGSFAIVFKVKTVHDIFALRCFTGRISDQQHRYLTLSKHLRRYHPECFVEFEYIPRGIKIQNEWWPIIKMPWVEGEHLDQHIERLVNRGDLSALSILAEAFRYMMSDLDRCQIAHGDLQHGNIIVGDQLKLIDYDGIYIPEFKGMSSLEIGHRNYQHPNRRNQDYDINLDSFSALVIYLTLLALSFDLNLWRFHQDDQLILGYKDFNNPSSSLAFEALLKSSSTKVCDLAKLLFLDCKDNRSQLPSIITISEGGPSDSLSLSPSFPNYSDTGYFDYGLNPKHLRCMTIQRKEIEKKDGYCFEPSCQNQLRSEFLHNKDIDKLFGKSLRFCSEACIAVFLLNETCAQCKKLLPDRFFFDETIVRTETAHFNKFCSEDCLKTFLLEKKCALCGRQLCQNTYNDEKLNSIFGRKILFCSNACYISFIERQLCALCQKRLTDQQITNESINRKNNKEIFFCSESCLQNYQKQKYCYHCGAGLEERYIDNLTINEYYGTQVRFCSQDCLQAHVTAIGFG